MFGFRPIADAQTRWHNSPMIGDTLRSAIVSEDGWCLESAVAEAIDAGTIRPMRWEVARKLADRLPECDGLKRDALTAMSKGTSEDRAGVARRLWEKESAISFRDGAKLRILVALTNEDGRLDSYEGSFIVQFADLAGIPGEKIQSAFGIANGS